MKGKDSSRSLFQRAQEHMLDAQVDAWLIYDFRGSNPVWRSLLLDPPLGTRRVFLCLPARGEPSMLVHDIERTQFQDQPVELESYSDRRDASTPSNLVIVEVNDLAMTHRCRRYGDMRA